MELTPGNSGFKVDPERRLFRRFMPEPRGDIDPNGVVDGMDFLEVISNQGLDIESAGWRDELDLNSDGMVDELDVQLLREQAGAGWRAEEL